MKKTAIVLLAVASLTACRDQKKSGPVAKPATNGTATQEKPKSTTLNKDMLKSVPASAIANEVVSFKPTDGHHFEMKAPQKCAGFELSTKTAREIACQLTEPGTHRIELNVCDDDKNYCKPVKFDLETTAPEGWDGAEKKGAVMQPPKHEHPPVEGFIINDPAEALAQAKADDKLLFVHFYGIWCPPCNMLEEYVYGQKEFLEATGEMVRVMIDADSDLSWEWKARFKVGGYPTVIVADSELQEIDRIVGYRPTAQIVKFAETAVENRGEPIDAVAAMQTDPTTAPDDVRKRIGMWHADRYEFEKASEWLADHPDPEAKKAGLVAKKRLADKAGDKEASIAVVEQLATEFPDDIQFSGWVGELLKAKPDAAKPLVSKAFGSLEKWAKSDELADSGYSPADIAWLKAELHKATGDADKAKAGYLESAELYGKMAEGSSLEVARGANMERAYALHKAGENEKAAALYEELAAAYENEFSFNYGYAYVLNELKQFDKAYEFAKKAHANAYGDNWLRAAHLKAKIEAASGKKDEAQKTVETTLAAAVVPKSTAVRTHRYLGKLRDLQAELR